MKIILLYEDKKLVLKTFKNEIISLEPTQGKGIKNLIPKKYFKDYQ